MFIPTRVIKNRRSENYATYVLVTLSMFEFVQVLARDSELQQQSDRGSDTCKNNE
jgi:hypothetical protein